jgi:hypothetical protein
MFLRSIVAVLIALPTVSGHSQHVTTASNPTVLVTASSETDNATSATGAATKVGGVVVGGAGANSSTYEHSEVWEVARRFSEECPAASFVTNPQTPHTLTIHTDYQKAGSMLTGQIVLYQLVLLNSENNPLYISKKNYLRREVKPICKVIEQQTK